MKNIMILTTAELRNYPADGTIFIGYDELNFAYWGMTDQSDGSVAVHLEYADAGGERHDIGVAAQDMNEPYWDM